MDEIKNHSEEEPTRNFYDVYTNKNGAKVYYLRTMEEFMKYKALYGKQSGQWSYTNKNANETQTNIFFFSKTRHLLCTR